MNANPISARPLYQQLREALVDKITSGEWKPGATLPNEGDLAREFGVSPGTMRKSLELMESEHLLTRKQGKGTFVNDHASDDFVVRFSNIRDKKGQRIAEYVKATDVSLGKATAMESERLRIHLHDPVYRLRRVRYHGNRPYMVDESSLPAALFPRLAEEKAISPRITVLSQHYGIVLGKAIESVSLGAATSSIAEPLGISANSPILILDRVVLSLDGRPVEWRVGHCHFVEEQYVAEIT
jgi:GntR family transcriptional regulator